jgi:hypothetical protein
VQALDHFISRWEANDYLTKIVFHTINTIEILLEKPKVTKEVVVQMMAECPKLNDMFFNSYIKLNFQTEQSAFKDLIVAKNISKKKLLLEVANMFAQKLNIEYYAELIKIKIMAIHTDSITFFVFEPFIASILGILIYIKYHAVFYSNFTIFHFTNIVDFLDATMSCLYSSNMIDRIKLYYKFFLIYCYSNPRKVVVVVVGV